MATISRQLNRIVIASTGAALVMLMLALLVAEIVKFQYDVTHHVSPLADTLGINLKPALAVHDSFQAREILSTVSSDAFVEAVYLFDQYDHPFAFFERPRPVAEVFSGDRPEELLEKDRILEVLGHNRQEVIFLWKRLAFFWPVVDDETKVGTLYLVVNLVPLYERFLWWLLAALPLILLSAGTGLWFARRLQQRISEPIAELARTMGSVTANHDLSVRVPRQGVREIATLADGFNAMIEQIGERDRRLEEANLLLEQRVVERTLELQQEIEERRRAEQELRLYSDAMAQSFDGINITDLKGDIIYCNDAATRIYGYRREELLGRSVGIFNVDPQQTRTEILPAIRARGSWNGEVRQRRQDGVEFPAALSVSVILDAEGQAIAMLGIVRDISDAKRTEENLRTLEKALATTNVGITITDLEGHLLYVNPAEARMHGYGVEELLGRHANALAPSHLRREASPVRAGSWTRRSENQHREGRTFPVQLTSDLVTDADGRPLAVVTVCEDITESLRAEEALRASEAKYRSLFEDSPVSLWEEDFSGVKECFDRLRAEGVTDFAAHFAAHPETVWECAGRVRIVAVNRATLGMFGAASREEFFGGLNRLFGEESFEPFVAELVALANGATGFECEGINRTIAGEPLYVHLRLSVFPGSEERLDRVIVSLVDLTERRRMEEALRLSEERFRQMVDLLPQPIFECDARGRLLFANRAGFETFGYSPEALAAGVAILDTVAPAQREAALSNLVRVLGGEQIGPVERLMLCRDGRTFPGLIYVAPILRDGRPAGMRGLIVDISSRKQIEERLLVSLREQEVLLREVHHRVKNNLQIISSLINLQLSRAAGKEVRAQLGTVRDRVRSMALIHEQLYRSPVLSRVDFALYLEEFVRQMCRLYGVDPAQIAVKLRVEPVQLDVELAIPCGLIVNELLTNAFKYAFPDGRRGEVTVGLEVVGERYRLFVADDGVGLPAGEAADRKTLGLQLVRSLGGQLGGTMSVESGSGTRVAISFAGAPPRRQAVVDAAP